MTETPEHLWFWIDACHYPQVSFTKPEGFVTVEYIRLQTDWNRLPASSGVVLLAARKTGRRAIGIEKGEERCAAIVERLSQVELTLGEL